MFGEGVEKVSGTANIYNRHVVISVAGACYADGSDFLDSDECATDKRSKGPPRRGNAVKGP